MEMTVKIGNSRPEIKEQIAESDFYMHSKETIEDIARKVRNSDGNMTLISQCVNNNTLLSRREPHLKMDSNDVLQKNLEEWKGCTSPRQKHR